MRLCSFLGCDKKHKGRGYCDKHLKRLQIHGDVNFVSSSRKKLGFQERFERHFIKTYDGCWLWHGGQNGIGYGVLKGAEGKFELAHRISYKLYVSCIPKGMLVLHKCDVRNCINPSHLFLGTSKDNTADMIRKGRARFPTKKLRATNE